MVIGSWIRGHEHARPGGPVLNLSLEVTHILPVLLDAFDIGGRKLSYIGRELKTMVGGQPQPFFSCNLSGGDLKCQRIKPLEAETLSHLRKVDSLHFPGRARCARVNGLGSHVRFNIFFELVNGVGMNF